MMKRTFAVAAALAATLLSGCVTQRPDVVPYYRAQQASVVRDGVVLNVRPVTIDGTQTGLGAVAGGVAGGVAGSTIGGYREGVVGSVVGAVIGGVAGNAIERAATTENGDELLVEMKNGQRRAIVQARGNESFHEGDPVLVIYTGRRVRVTHAPKSAYGRQPRSGATAPPPNGRDLPDGPDLPDAPDLPPPPAYIAPGDPIS